VNVPVILFALHFSLAAPAHAATADALIQEGLAAEAAHDSGRALDHFLAADVARPNDPYILQKIAQQYSDSTGDAPEPAARKKLATQALAYAERASQLDPDNAVNTLSVAISYGKIGLYSNLREKITYVRRSEEYAERALAQDPNYDWAYHVLGRWNYEVAKLGKTKRFLVELLYGGLPAASSGRAVDLLQRAVELAPKNPAHHIELGFAYLADDQPAAARQAFTAGLALPNLGKHDAETKDRARAALAEF